MQHISARPSPAIGAPALRGAPSDYLDGSHQARMGVGLRVPLCLFSRTPLCQLSRTALCPLFRTALCLLTRTPLRLLSRAPLCSAELSTPPRARDCRQRPWRAPGAAQCIDDGRGGHPLALVRCIPPPAHAPAVAL
eukprot:362982-Chlamydomonas_euryale.AAC.18